MLRSTPFYHAHVKNLVIAFGAIFSDIKIVRTNSDGSVSQTINVPLAWGPKEKWVQRVEQDPTLENQTMVTLPRMGFEILSYAYDASRKTNRMSQVICNDSNGTTRKALYAPVPYNIEIGFYILTNNYEDGLQILEQILPYFAPEYTIYLKSVPELNITQEIPVILNGVQLHDDYEGNFDTTRLVTHTLGFTLKTGFFGGQDSQSIIKKVIVDVTTETGKVIYTAEGTVPGAPLITDSWLEEL